MWFAGRWRHRLLGLQRRGQADPPDGDFMAVSAGGWHSCGLCGPVASSSAGETTVTARLNHLAKAEHP